MEGTLPKLLAQTLQRDRLIEVLLDVAADGFDRIRLRIAAELSGPAAQAGAKSGFFRLLRTREELHILAPGAARPTRRSAINASRGDGKNKLSVAMGVACDHSVPALIVANPGIFGLSALGFCRVCVQRGHGCVVCKYGTGARVRESHVRSSHNRNVYCAGAGNGLSESCGQTEFALVSGND